MSTKINDQLSDSKSVAQMGATGASDEIEENKY